MTAATPIRPLIPVVRDELLLLMSCDRGGERASAVAANGRVFVPKAKGATP